MKYLGVLVTNGQMKILNELKTYSVDKSEYIRKLLNDNLPQDRETIKEKYNAKKQAGLV
jgi:hypothetical protein